MKEQMLWTVYSWRWCWNKLKLISWRVEGADWFKSGVH